MVTVNLPASDTTYVCYNRPTDNMPSVFTGIKEDHIGIFQRDISDMSYHGLCQTYIKVDLSSIPTGSTILFVSITIYTQYVTDGYTPFPIVFQKTGSSWTGDTLTWAGATGGSDVIGSGNLDSTLNPGDFTFTLDSSYFQANIGGSLSTVLSATDSPNSFSEVPSATLDGIRKGTNRPFFTIVYAPPSAATPDDDVVVFE